MADIGINVGSGVGSNIAGQAEYTTEIVKDMGIVPGETGQVLDPNLRSRVVPAVNVGVQFTAPKDKVRAAADKIGLPDTMAPRNASVLVGATQAAPLRYGDNKEIWANNTALAVTVTSRRLLGVKEQNAIGPELGVGVTRTHAEGKCPDPYGFEEPTACEATSKGLWIYGGYGIERAVVPKWLSWTGMEGTWASGGVTFAVPPAAWGDSTPTTGILGLTFGGYWGLRGVNTNKVAQKKDSSDPKPTMWYKDADDDGYGGVKTFMMAVDQPIGWVASPLDCNDSNVDINPDAEEVLGNTVDENCNNNLER